MQNAMRRATASVVSSARILSVNIWIVYREEIRHE